MRRRVLVAAAALLLAGPFLLALPQGGYGDVPRIVAGVIAWLLVALAAVLAPTPLPRSAAGRLALGGLAALAALTLASTLWAPIKAPAYADGERVVAYVGVMTAALAILPAVRALRLVEPALVGGATLIAGYGLSERVLPWLVTLVRSPAAGGRLNQPLGYWNAAGAVAAIGVVLAAAVAGDGSRAPRTRAMAAAVAPVLGAAVALSFSRGALLAAALGGAVTLLARHTRRQARATALVLLVAAVAGVVADLLPSVTDYQGTASTRDLQGAVLGAVIVVAGLAGAGLQLLVARREAAGGVASGTLPRRARQWAAAAAVAAVIAAVVLVAVNDRGSVGTPQFGATASRLSSVQSNRYAYWKVAARTWLHHPLLGVGASGFAVEWLRHRTVNEGAHDAHSLPLETAAEMGLAGFLALAAFAAGVAIAAWRLARGAPGVAAGAIGGLTAWVAHACIDWAWEMPADTLFGLLLATALVAGAERLHRPRRPAAEPERAAAAAV